MLQRLHIPPALLRSMLEHCRLSAPQEACGMMGGKTSQVDCRIPIRNAAQSPTRFLMDTGEQWRALQWLEESGRELLALYHSHPQGPNHLSPTDLAEAAYPVVHILCWQQAGKWQARGFWIEDGQAQEVAL